MAGLIILVLIIGLSVVFHGGKKTKGSGAAGGGKNTYPYRRDVERRLPDGSITTRGYAAVHPGEFAHWQFGPENVFGETIDRTDWENWRINYYGM
jgi:hypothetical protein